MRTYPFPASPRSLPAELRSQLRQRLEAERATLLARTRVDVDDDSFALTATHGQGETELVTRDVAVSLATTLEQAAATTLDAIESALARIDTTAFGMCETCGRPIPVERLLALPEASRCVSCLQTQRERR